MQFVSLLLAFAFAESALDATDSKVATDADAHTAVHTDENVHDLHDALVDVHEDVGSTLDGVLEKPHSKKVGLLTKKTAKKSATKKFAKAVRMVLSLHEVMGPIHAKLDAAIPEMKAGEAKDHAKALLTHIKALDGYSKKMGVLVANLAALEHGSKEEKEGAMVKLLNGMEEFSAGIKKHMAALHALKAKHKTAESESDMPVMGSGKLQAILHGMETKLRDELKDPRVKSSKEFGKQVKFDLLMYVLVKKAVDESDALFVAAAAAFRKNPTEEVKNTVGTLVKEKMDEIQHKLRTSMKAIETALLSESEPSSHVEGDATEADEEPDAAKATEAEAEETDAPDKDTDADTDEKKEQHVSELQGDDSEDSDEEAKEPVEPKEADSQESETAMEEPQADLSAILGKLGAALPSKEAMDDAQITRGEEAKVEASGKAHLSASVGAAGEMKF